MSENIYFDSPYKFTDPIRYFKANDPIYWEVENIPIKQLEENVRWVKSQVEGVLGSVAQTVSSLQGEVNNSLGSFEIDRSKFSELRPYVDGTNNILKVKAGKFSARINDAYDINVLQTILQTGGIDNLSKNEWQVQTLAASSLRSIVEKFRQDAFFVGANGLAERIFTFEIATPDTPANIQGLNPVRYPGHQGWGWWRDATREARTYPYETTRGPLYTLSWAESEFIKRWRGVTRTAIVNVPSELTVEIPAFDPQDHYYTDFQNVKQLLPATQRIDLVFIYTKPVDTSSTTIRSFGADGLTPKKITTPQLGIVKGAGVGINLYRPDNNGSPATGFDIITKFSDSTTQRILSHHGDEIGPNLGFGSIKGSFPSPDDLMNIAPLLCENLETSDFRLIGQSILPVAYVVVRESAELNQNAAPIINSSDVIDIRPFFRTTELTYNERAGIAAATPQLSLANPVATEAYVDYHIEQISNNLGSQIQVVNGNILDTTKLLAAGYIMGGYDYGMEGAMGRLLNLLENNNGRDEAFMKARVRNYLSYEREVPQYPEWDIGRWVALNNSYTNKGQEPLDRMEVFFDSGSVIGTKNTRTGNSVGSYTGNSNFVVMKKTIMLDAANQGIPASNDYVVLADLHQCNGRYQPEISIERKPGWFTIYIKLYYTPYTQTTGLGAFYFANRANAAPLFEIRDTLQISNYYASTGGSNSISAIKNVFCTYPTVSYKVFSLPRTNVGLTTSLAGDNPLLTI